MSEQMEMGHSAEIEEALGTYFSAPEPDPAFVARLEGQLMAQHRARAVPAGKERPSLHRFWDLIWQPVRHHRWATVGIAVFLAVVVALLAVGPQRVWADLQRLLGYVPGVGFVNLEEARVLTAPVTVSRDGVTVRVEHVLAEPHRTTVLIASEGLPPRDKGADRSRDLRAMSPDGVALRLPDDTRLSPNTMVFGWGEARLGFPPLPQDVYHLTLEVKRLPQVPAGVAPESWEIPVTLRPATGELTADLFPEAYVPADASDTHADVTLRLVAAAHNPEVTALQMEMEWRNQAWQEPVLGLWGPDLPPTLLRDNLGHVYGRVSVPGFETGVAVQETPPPGYTDMPPLPASGILTEELTLTFAPISPSARRLSLSIDQVSFAVAVAETFNLDLGENPQPGDSWTLDEHLTVAGFPIHVTGVHLEHEDRPTLQCEYKLTFDVEREEVGDSALTGIALEVPFGGRCSGRFSGSFIPDGKARPSAIGDVLPLQPFTVTVTHAQVSVRGPWTLSWLVPGADEQDVPVSPLTLRPGDVGQTRGPLSLTIDGATVTDRLTAVHLAAGPLPRGAELRFPSRSEETAPYLEDDRGRRYELEEDVDWRPEGETFATSPVSQTLTFQPLQPLARRVTLRVPQAELILPAQGSFDVTVPPGIELEPRFEVTRTMEAIVSPDSPGAIVWRSSDPWDVDVTLDAAGYRVHLTEASLEQFGGATQLALTSERIRLGAGDYQLTGLGVVSATAPSGEEVRLGWGLDMRGFFEDRFPPETRHRAVLIFRDLESEPVSPGRYVVAVDTLRVLVQGPWDLSWELPGP